MITPSTKRGNLFIAAIKRETNNPSVEPQSARAKCQHDDRAYLEQLRRRLGNEMRARRERQ